MDTQAPETARLDTNEARLREEILAFQKEQVRNMAENNLRLRQLRGITASDPCAGDHLSDSKKSMAQLGIQTLSDLEKRQIVLMKSANAKLDNLLENNTRLTVQLDANFETAEDTSAEDFITAEEGSSDADAENKIPKASNKIQSPLSRKSKKKTIQGGRSGIKPTKKRINEDHVDVAYLPKVPRRNKPRKSTTRPLPEQHYWNSSSDEDSSRSLAHFKCIFCGEKYESLSLLVLHKLCCSKMNQEMKAAQDHAGTPH